MSEDKTIEDADEEVEAALDIIPDKFQQTGQPFIDDILSGALDPGKLADANPADAMRSGLLESDLIKETSELKKDLQYVKVIANAPTTLEQAAFKVKAAIDHAQAVAFLSRQLATKLAQVNERLDEKHDTNFESLAQEAEDASRKALMHWQTADPQDEANYKLNLARALREAMTAVNKGIELLNIARQIVAAADRSVQELATTIHEAEAKAKEWAEKAVSAANAAESACAGEPEAIIAIELESGPEMAPTEFPQPLPPGEIREKVEEEPLFEEGDARKPVVKGKPWKGKDQPPDVEIIRAIPLKDVDFFHYKAPAGSGTTTSTVGPRTLTVVWRGLGEGEVTSAPAGISCTHVTGSTCQAVFNTGQGVTLSPAPAAFSVFSHWGGGECDQDNGAAGCVVNMNSDRTVNVWIE